MQKTNNTTVAPGSLPDDYQEVLYWKLTDQPSRLLALNVFGVFLFIGFCWIFFTLAASLGKLPTEFVFSPVSFGVILLGILLTLILHELTHGMVMRIFGARPRYGVLWKQMMFYATSPGFAYRRNDYVLIALAPLVFISVLVVLGMWLLQGTSWVALLSVCGVMNASGAVGDLWITAIVLRHANTAYVMDERDGVRVFLPKS